MKGVTIKKLLFTCCILVLSFILSSGVYAVSINKTNSSVLIDSNITVSIADTTNMTNEQIEKITDAVIAYHCGYEYADISMPYGLTCTLLGHKTQTTSTSVIEHKVRATNPRCLESFYKVTSCSRCDYVDMEFLTDVYISCCD